MVEHQQLRKLTKIYGLVTQCYNQPLEELELNLPQCQLLTYVSGEELSVAQAAQRLGFSPTRTSNLVVDLCKRGYLSQRVAEKDRRRRYLALTVLGKKDLQLIQAKLPGMLDETLEHLHQVGNALEVH
ncbi:MarR family winged helix-turn-helix transcriptional regulator [Levilactobacillus tujiorum]|uniref:MarR family transcriptional regulator n=1 Tax=Levilactobacillus tujiorum TaxID=2912243 RepID=A0ABX1L4M7_9LACO|nr:helix-turn-helix domain-containing protein [Levilactobacillus tujiorum]MCH5464991.1 MarR family transcriptional regulator [Levilactobacillus tujiorum]NLR11971.1 MarR family transcriptional regulator [Lactobacillus sp. HBUAS51387]NLR29981.1 MarR family transcriptional regulator [Levilactobacillus tujiorum]